MKVSKRTLITLICGALLLLAATGTTLAYLKDNTATLRNVFQPGKVSCAVVENGQVYPANTVNVSSKSDVTVKNTGNVPAFIRATIVVTWKSTGGTVYAAKPVAGEDYTLELNTAAWTKGTDGFYYCQSGVEPNAETARLIKSANQLRSGPEGYTLSIEILAEAIQKEALADSAQGAWAEAKRK